MGALRQGRARSRRRGCASRKRFSLTRRLDAFNAQLSFRSRSLGPSGHLRPEPASARQPVRAAPPLPERRQRYRGSGPSRALEPATNHPSVSAVPRGSPCRSATMVAQSVRTGARFTRMVAISDMAGGYGGQRRRPIASIWACQGNKQSRRAATQSGHCWTARRAGRFQHNQCLAVIPAVPSAQDFAGGWPSRPGGAAIDAVVYPRWLALAQESPGLRMPRLRRPPSTQDAQVPTISSIHIRSRSGK